MCNVYILFVYSAAVYASVVWRLNSYLRCLIWQVEMHWSERVLSCRRRRGFLLAVVLVGAAWMGRKPG